MFDYFKSATLLITLLNPFLIIVYLVDVIQKLSHSQFRKVLIRAGLIASLVFFAFAIMGDTIFSGILQVEFASFQIFGGIVFLLIGIQFVFKGPLALEMLRGESEHIAGSIAMPVLIGPGTIGASVVIGEGHDAISACLIIFVAVVISIISILALKLIHDVVNQKREGLVERYIDIAGRMTALYVGTVAINMIMKGTVSWINKL